MTRVHHLLMASPPIAPLIERAEADSALQRVIERAGSLSVSGA
ncbi:MAG: hypothetical protein ABR539_04240 [Halomonas sp.]